MEVNDKLHTPADFPLGLVLWPPLIIRLGELSPFGRCGEEESLVIQSVT
jgi:hypothetical protein